MICDAPVSAFAFLTGRLRARTDRLGTSLKSNSESLLPLLVEACRRRCPAIAFEATSRLDIEEGRLAVCG